MADDDVIDDADELDEDELDDAVDVDELDEDELEGVGLEDDDLDDDDDATITGDDLVEEAAEAPAEGTTKVATRAKKGDDEVEEEDDDVDPDDVEADLDTILKDRIAAAEEDEDEEEVEVTDTRGTETPDGVTPKKANEFVCPGCFLLVNRGQFGPPDNMTCPVGESDCPAIAQLQKAKK
jgi:hypothetical protein